MATTIEPRPMTFTEFMELPEGTPAQLIDGNIVCDPAPSFGHADALIEIATLMKAFVKARALGRVLIAPVDVKLSDREVYQPDIIFISNEQFSRDRKMLDGAPELAVEVLSPSTARYDRGHKLRTYQASGVQEYWIVDPIERSIEIHVNEGKEFVLASRATSGGAVTSGILAGLQVAVDDVMPA